MMEEGHKPSKQPTLTQEPVQVLMNVNIDREVTSPPPGGAERCLAIVAGETKDCLDIIPESTSEVIVSNDKSTQVADSPSFILGELNLQLMHCTFPTMSASKGLELLSTCQDEEG